MTTRSTGCWLATITLLAILITTSNADDTAVGFVEIPAGSFVMGADASRDSQAFDNERWSPVQGEGTVHLPTYYIARHEVTVGELTQFARTGTWTLDRRALSGLPTHPATFVSWPDTLAYCRWLESKLKSDTSTPARIQQRLRDGWRVSIPTEAEWEKAARGSDRRKYPWGNELLPGRANFGASATTPVGQFACVECANGLADMSGNVWEWTRSPYQPYPYDPMDDRSNLEADALWVIRGGHFGDGPRLVRTTARGAADPGARRAFIGFRVALTPPR